MKKFLTPVLCTLIAICVNAQDVTKETSVTNEIEITEKRASEEIDKQVVTSVLSEKSPTEVEKTITANIHKPWDVLLKKYVTATGNVNYKGFKKDQIAFKAYLATLSKTEPQNDWSKNQKLAYWMNAYNAFTVQLILDNYPLQSIKDIKKPWDLRFFQIGKKWYNLNEIEHQILRKMGDPRIHFGINCTSFSCPPLLNKAFTSENVTKELEKLAVAFVNDEKRNKISEDAIEISKIFQWFGKDFKTKGSLIDFLNQYTTTKISSTAKQRFMNYDWNLNE